MKKHLPYWILLFFGLCFNSLNAQVTQCYIANDDHTDYMWTADEAAYKDSFIKMIDYYIAKSNATNGLASDFQSRFNCDGNFWLWEYEKNKSATEFQNLINKIKSGHISVPYNALVSCYGANPAEGAIRGMYYAGYLERKFGLDLDLAVAMENQTLPLGLGSLWAGAGAKYSWKGVCSCANKVTGLENRSKEIYWYKGTDDSKILMKWYSIDGGNNQDLGGYAEARNPEQAVDHLSSKLNTTKYPYNIGGAFGFGWDDKESTTDNFITTAQNKTTNARKVIVSNESDFFKSFETAYGASLPSETLAYGNEWDLYSASMPEVSARVKRAVEKLRAAEGLASLVSAKSSGFDADLETQRRTAWMALGLYWEHDWTADGPVARDSRATWQRKLEGQITSYVDALYNRAQSTLGTQIVKVGSNTRFYAFNPLSWVRTDVVDYPYSLAGEVKVIDLSTGTEVPAQRVTVNAIQYLRVLASDIPSVGYKVFEIQSGTPATLSNAATVTGNVLENSLFKVTVTNQGVITSLIDKANGNKECVASIDGLFMNDLGSGSDNSGTLVIENAGPVSVTFKCTGGSPLAHTSRITLFRAIARVDINNQITQNYGTVNSWAFSYNIPTPDIWHEEVGAIIKAKLTTNGGNYATQNARYDWLTMNHFADVNASSYGVTLSNADCFFMQVGNSTTSTLNPGNVSQLKVLTGGQIDGGGLGIPNQGGDSFFTQRFALGTHLAFDAAGSMCFSLEHQNPLVATTVSGVASANAYPEKTFSFLSISDLKVLLWSLKPSEDGAAQGYITRVWNFGGSTSNSAISFGGDITDANVTTHVETNQGSAGFSGNTLSASVGKNQIKSFRVKIPTITEVPIVAATSVSVSPTTASLNVAGTQQLTATVAPSNATNKNVTWSSGNTSVATVNASGIITAVATGTATITVTTQDGGKIATSSVTVNTATGGDGLKGEYYNNKTFASPIAVTRTDGTINFNWGSGSYATGQSVDNFSTRWTGQVQPKYTETYIFETETDDGVRLWVNDIQLVNAWVNQGPTKIPGTISLTAGTKYTIKMEYYENGGGAVARLRWSSPSQAYEIIPQSQLYSTSTSVAVTGLSVSPTTASLNVSGTQQLIASVAPSNATNKNVTWGSGNTSVATVNASGLVTAVAAGTATITVTTQDGGKTATSAITVTTSTVTVTGVSVSPTTASLNVSGTQQLTASVAPSNATNKNVTWSSGTPAVATVNSSGLVTAVAAGTSIITVTTQDGTKIATSTITVTTGTVAVTGLSVSPTSASVAVNGTQQLTVTITPSNATNKNVSWSSSNTTIATVSSTGLLTGKAAGTATITVTSQDGSNNSATSAITVTSGGTWGPATRYEAENGFNSCLTVASSIGGYSGSGYVMNLTTNCSETKFDKGVSDVTPTKMDIRYANGTGGNVTNLALYIGSNQKIQDLVFPSTGSFSTWGTITVTFNQDPSWGSNIIMKSSTNVSTSVNIDYSEISVGTGGRLITEETQKIEGVSVHPNPTHEVLNVTFYSENESIISIELMTSMSQSVRRISHRTTKGTNTVVLDVKGLEHGFYLLQVRDGSVKTVKKIIIGK